MILIPSPGDLVTTNMVRIVTPLERSQKTKFREWSVHEPALVTAVDTNRFGNTVVTFMLVRTRSLCTYEIILQPREPMLGVFKLLMTGARHHAH